MKRTTATAAAIAATIALTGCTQVSSAKDKAVDKAHDSITKIEATRPTEGITDWAKDKVSRKTDAAVTANPATVALAKANLAKLPIKGNAPKTGYSRSQFGPAWTDNQDAPLGHNGCGTRDDILARDLTGAKRKAGSRCIVVAGTLHDSYTGKTMTFTKAKASAVQIDHIVPLSLMWQRGSQNWTQAERVRWANHPTNLKAVDGPTNGAKGDKSPAAWMPPNRAAWCSYSVSFVDAATDMNRTIKPANGSPALWLSKADKDMLVRGLSTCKA